MKLGSMSAKACYHQLTLSCRIDRKLDVAKSIHISGFGASEFELRPVLVAVHRSS
jgi:hypothetical protein